LYSALFPVKVCGGVGIFDFIFRNKLEPLSERQIRDRLASSSAAAQL